MANHGHLFLTLPCTQARSQLPDLPTTRCPGPSRTSFRAHNAILRILLYSPWNIPDLLSCVSPFATLDYSFLVCLSFPLQVNAKKGFLASTTPLAYFSFSHSLMDTQTPSFSLGRKENSLFLKPVPTLCEFWFSGPGWRRTGLHALPAISAILSLPTPVLL